LGLNVTSQVKKTLESGFGASSCEWFSAISSSDVEALHKRTSTLINLSLEEGFGLPLIEALAAGSNIISIHQPLTETLLGDSAVLLQDGDVTNIADQLRVLPDSWPTIETRMARAASFSWETAALGIGGLLNSARSH